MKTKNKVSWIYLLVCIICFFTLTINYNPIIGMIYMYMLFNMAIHDMCVDVVNNNQDRVLLWIGINFIVGGCLAVYYFRAMDMMVSIVLVLAIIIITYMNYLIIKKVD